MLACGTLIFKIAFILKYFLKFSINSNNYNRMAISRTFKDKENWFEKS